MVPLYNIIRFVFFSCLNTPFFAKILEDFCDGIDLQRYDLSPDRTEISFIVDIKNPNDISVFTDKIKKLGSTVSINIMDYQDLHEV
mgnify:CR=1 FL=1